MNQVKKFLELNRLSVELVPNSAKQGRTHTLDGRGPAGDPVTPRQQPLINLDLCLGFPQVIQVTEQPDVEVLIGSGMEHC